MTTAVERTEGRVLPRTSPIPLRPCRRRQSRRWAPGSTFLPTTPALNLAPGAGRAFTVWPGGGTRRIRSCQWYADRVEVGIGGNVCVSMGHGVSWRRTSDREGPAVRELRYAREERRLWGEREALLSERRAALGRSRLYIARKPAGFRRGQGLRTWWVGVGGMGRSASRIGPAAHLGLVEFLVKCLPYF